MRVGVAAFALYFLAVAVVMVVAPKAFFEHVGPFGVRNDHYIRDTATFSAAFGVALAVAYRRVGWRVPVLACATIQFALHAVNHLVDIDEAHPHWLGPADFASLALSALLLVGLVRQAHRQEEARP